MEQFYDPVGDTVQFWKVRSSNLRSGEKKLMAAMVQQALEDYVRWATALSRKERTLYEHGRDWIESTDPGGDNYLSFEACCTALDLSAAWIREQMRKWADAKQRKITRNFAVAG